MKHVPKDVRDVVRYIYKEMDWKKIGVVELIENVKDENVVWHLFGLVALRHKTGPYVPPQQGLLHIK